MRRTLRQTRRPGLETFLQRAALLFGVVALVVQLVGWSTMPVMSMTAAAADPEICSVHESGTPSPDPADHHRRGCPLCTLVHGLSGPPPASLVGEPVRYVVARLRPLTGELVAAGWFLSSLQARGPPVVG